MKPLFISLLALVATLSLSAATPADSLEGHVYARPSTHFIEIFRPNYLTSGVPIDRPVSCATADIKFQVSLRANVWRNMGGKGVDCFVGYTQTSLWNIYEHSSPFYDNTYNPGIYFEKAFSRQGNTLGTLQFGYEHKSNGRDDQHSRSVNYLFATYTHLLSHGFALQGKAWFGHGYIEDTGGLEMYNRYVGYFHVAAMWASSDRRVEASVMLSPTGQFNDINLAAEVCYRIGAKHNNPYLYVQLHRGFTEAYRTCHPDITPRTMIRLGICIRPHNTNIF